MNFLKKFVLLLILPSALFAEKFVEGELIGQLGNQMFIIASTIGLARDNGATPIFPDLKKQTQWNMSENYRNIFFRINADEPKVKRKRIYKEPFFHYKKIPYRKNMVIKGHFQSEKYFAKHKKEILRLFAPSQKILNYLGGKYSDIISHPKTVAIHFRDYMKDQRWHPNCTWKYFQKAMDEFPEDCLFVVFSNNINWCKREFQKINRNFRFVEGEHFHHDFFLMSMCKHNIISNSSFSWWAAYLNQNKNKKVVAPQLWFARDYKQDTYDVVPREWIRVDYEK